MHDWPAPLRAQFQALLRQFMKGEGEAWIGIAAIECLGATGSFIGTRRRGGRVETLGVQPLTRAFVWMDGAAPELWVDPRDKRYRELFDQFARERLGLAGRPGGTDWNVDHVFPKAAGVLDGMSHVRVLGIGAAGNQSLGRTVEKAMKQRADTAPGTKRIRHATWMTIGKAAGFAGWETLPHGKDAAGNQAAVTALFGYLAQLGILPPAGRVEHGMTAHTLTRIR